jgi:hypothetical protein
MAFAQTGFAQFMAGPSGRAARILAGLALVAWGYPQRAEIGGIVLLAVGVLGLATGVLNVCIISALFGGPFRGARIREVKPGP